MACCWLSTGESPGDNAAARVASRDDLIQHTYWICTPQGQHGSTSACRLYVDRPDSNPSFFFFPIWEGSFSLLECWNSINHFTQPLPPPLLNIEPKGLQTPSTYSPAKPHPSHSFIKKVLRFYSRYLVKTKPVKIPARRGEGLIKPALSGVLLF